MPTSSAKGRSAKGEVGEGRVSGLAWARAGRLTAPVSLTRSGRAWRLVLGVAVIGTVVAGTLVGDDRWWPFAPMAQYAFSVENDGGVISSPYMAAETVDGDRVRVDLSREALGMERSEIEGQLPSIVADPSKLQSVAVLHARRQPEQARWRVVEVRTTRIVLGEDGSRTDELLARWQVRHPHDPERGL